MLSILKKIFISLIFVQLEVLIPKLAAATTNLYPVNYCNKILISNSLSSTFNTNTNTNTNTKANTSSYALLSKGNKLTKNSLFKIYRPHTGSEILGENSDGSVSVELRVLSPFLGQRVFVFGDFNQWSFETAIELNRENKNSPSFSSSSFSSPSSSSNEQLNLNQTLSDYLSVVIPSIRDGSEYRFIIIKDKPVNDNEAIKTVSKGTTPSGTAAVRLPLSTTQKLREGLQVLDPSSYRYTENDPKKDPPYLNSVFVDTRKIKAQTQRINLKEGPLVVAKVDIRGLIEKYFDQNQGGSQAKIQIPPLNETYKFIAESGVINELKKYFDAVEFLPFAQTLDPSTWQHRFLVYGLFAVDSRYGSLEDFVKMLDAFNKAHVGVIMDTVLGHFPQYGNEGARKIDPVGLVKWLDEKGQPLFLGGLTEWNTVRYNYLDSRVRTFLIESVLEFLVHYPISGIRMDNIDGIRSSPGGEIFLKELALALEKYTPEVLYHAEALGLPKRLTSDLNNKGFDFDTVNADVFFQKVMGQIFLVAKDLNLLRIVETIKTFGVGELGPAQTSTGTHDHMGNNRERNTIKGAYLVDSIGNAEFHIVGKMIVYQVLASVTGSSTLLLPQNLFLQRGNFNEQTAIDWKLASHPKRKNYFDFMKAFFSYRRQEQAFRLNNVEPSIVNHVDDNNKILSIVRTNPETGKKILIVINMIETEQKEYSLPSPFLENQSFHIELNSDKFFGSFSNQKKKLNDSLNADAEVELVSNSNQISNSNQDSNLNSNNFHVIEGNKILLPRLAPYGIIIIEENK